MRAIPTNTTATRLDMTPANAVPASVASAPGTQARDMLGRVRIERLILHGLNNRAEELQLVDEPAVLTGESERFFALHIESAAERAEWQAHFTDGDIATLCRALLSSQSDFVSASRQLALRLYEQMRPRTVAPGDFVAAVFTDGASLRRLALLKLDPDQRLARTFTSSGGRTRVSIDAARNLLPETRNLQKCALLTLAGTDDGFAVTLLDNQAGPHSEGVAAFFYRGFLTTQLEPSPRRHTRDFMRCCDTWLAGYRDTLSPADVTAFYDIRRMHLHAGELDIRRFVTDALPRYPALARELEERLTASLTSLGASADAPSGQFPVDPVVAAPLLNRVTLELDGGARLIVPADRYADLVRISPERTAENKVRIVIESLTLKEVSDR
jgi:37-kD nucleoid-associated bacterial protein